jgi:choline dehydrogenase-like flavoprotein
MVHAKADGEVNGIRPALHYPNVTLFTGAKVERLYTSESGREITEVKAIIDGHSQRFRGDLVAVCCGTINSAALLLRSANDRYPNGLANSSDQVGRNFMKHLSTALVAFSEEPNPDVYQKTIALNDFYWGEPDFPYLWAWCRIRGTSKQL